ncbi:hypothetical protein BDR26DRAFT_966274 [Obelidium mucronatum]|nr:hypothetical protein BDR26DRAFT_966274 [Obelidium mucronatum]
MRLLQATLASGLPHAPVAGVKCGAKDGAAGGVGAGEGARRHKGEDSNCSDGSSSSNNATSDSRIWTLGTWRKGTDGGLTTRPTPPRSNKGDTTRMCATAEPATAVGEPDRQQGEPQHAAKTGNASDYGASARHQKRTGHRTCNLRISNYGVETTVRTANHKLVMNLTGVQLDHLNENLTVAEVPATQNLFNVESTAAVDKEHKALVLGIDNAHHQQPSEIAKAMLQLWTEKGHKIVQAFGRSTTNSHELVVSLYFETEQDKLRCMQLHPCLYFNRNTAILADEDKTLDIRRHREQTRTLVVKNVEKYTRAQDWHDAVRALGNGKVNYKIVRGDRIKIIPYSLVVVMKAEDDAKKMDNTVYQFPESNATFTLVRKLVRKPDGTYRNRDDCKHCHLHQNCPTHKKEVEERLKRLGQRTCYLSMSGEEVGQIRVDLRNLESKGLRLTEAQAEGCCHLEIHMAEAIKPIKPTTRMGNSTTELPNATGILSKAQRMALQGAPPTAPTGRTFQTEEERKEELMTAVQAEVKELKKKMETKMEAEMERVKGELEETMAIWMKEKENNLNDQWAKIQNDMDEETIKPTTETREETETGEETDQPTKLEPLDQEMGEEEEGETLGEAIIGEIKVLNKEIFGCNEGEEDEYVGLKKRVVKLEELWRKHQRKEITRKTIGKKSAGVEYIERHDGKGKKGEKKKRPETGRTNDE